MAFFNSKPGIFFLVRLETLFWDKKQLLIVTADLTVGVLSSLIFLLSRASSCLFSSRCRRNV